MLLCGRTLENSEMKIERRALLRGGAASFVLASIPGLALAKQGMRKLKLENLHTGERLAAEYCVEGCYQPDAIAAINHILRDFRTGEVHAIDPRLLDLLHDLNARLETDAAFQVISGYRSPHTNAMLHERSSGVASKSLHPQGKAIDIRVPGRALHIVHAIALSMARGGVGLYPTSDFVHVDVGRVRRWNGV
jgi:uncharacterized protein YcbK (DUF882 family)